MFDGREPENPPDLGGVVDVMLEHARLLAAWLGEEGRAMRAFRKHSSSWYTKGFRGGAPLRERLMQVSALAELEEVLAAVDRTQPFPPEAMRVPRGKTAGTQKVALPEGYLDDLDDAVAPGIEAEAADSAASAASAPGQVVDDVEPREPRGRSPTGWTCAGSTRW